MTKKQIIAAIDRYIKRHSDSVLFYFMDYGVWYIGITKDPPTRKVAHGKPEKWRCWKANSAKVAREIEKHFHQKGMNGAGGGGNDMRHVYVY